MLWPQAQSAAKRASPMVPFNGHLAKRQSGFHVAYLGFDVASAAQVCDEFWCQDAPCAADQHAGLFLAVAPSSTCRCGFTILMKAASCSMVLICGRCGSRPCGADLLCPAG